MEYRSGDNIKNTEKCKPGYKYNLRLKQCIPNAAYVDAGGNVRLSEPIGYNDNVKPPSTPEQAPDATADPESKRRSAREKGNARTAYQAAAQSPVPKPTPRSK